jgi:AraC family transcriptional regulator of adaptative response/methylated-DNA-[protein]-cysteine methyltransferase
MEIPYQFLDTPFAQLLVAQYEDKLCFAGFTTTLTVLQQTFPEARLVSSDKAVLPGGYEALFKPYNFNEFYLQGTDFQKAVWQALLAIKPGEKQSYSDIANAIGAPKAVRAVGSAIGKNPICLAIPCHRVISKQGHLGGYSWGTQIKRALLDYERNTFKADA